MARNKRKKEKKRQLRNGLMAMIEELKQEKISLSSKIKIETAIKQKYFDMWRISEKEKEKLKTSRQAFLGSVQKAHSAAQTTSEILNIDSSLLDDLAPEGKIIGKGRFGTVCLKRFRSSPVAVKYFDSSSRSRDVEREALYLSQCCHLNLPLMYGANCVKQPYFIVFQFYGNENHSAATLHGILNQNTGPEIHLPEHWLHIVAQLSDAVAYLHTKEILHNDIKSDNIVVVSNSNATTSFSPILIDFGKACMTSEAKKKHLSREEKLRYKREHYHIAPEIVEGTQPATAKSDVYSLGVGIASIYRYCKYRPLKEIARQCLGPFSERCNSLELQEIVVSLAKLTG